MATVSDYTQLKSGADIASASGFGNGKIIGIVESGSLKQYEVGLTDLGSGIQMADGKFANPVLSGSDFVDGTKVRIGTESGSLNQGEEATTTGNRSGKENQGSTSCAYGVGSAEFNQSSAACSYGAFSANLDQGVAATAYGSEAGRNSQGPFSCAIGRRAGRDNQPQNSIVINSDSEANTPSSTKQIVIGRSDYSVFIGDGNVQSVSDLRDKYDIQDIPIGLDFVNSLRPLFYKYDIRDLYNETTDSGEVINHPSDGSRAGKRFHAGFGAQHIKESLDEAGVDFGLYRDLSVNAEAPHKDRMKDKLALCYIELIPVLTRAVQEVDDKTKEIESLKSEMRSITDRLAELERLTSN